MVSDSTATKVTTAESVTCRSCGSTDVVPVLDMGEMPLANRFLESGELANDEPRYPLELAFCAACALVQITYTVPPEILFRDYLYFSSYSDTMVQHAKALARRVTDLAGLGPRSLVVELGSNDGYLLQHFIHSGIPVLGIEPARNVAAEANARGIPTVSEFFDSERAQALRGDGLRANAIIANNVLAHVADLNSFVRGIRILLADDGVGVIEVPYVKDLLDRCEFDTIYHEHLCYFSLTALRSLFRRHELSVVRVDHLAIHGGSLRIYVSPQGQFHDGSVEALANEEAGWGVGTPDPYRRFAREAEHGKVTLLEFLIRLKRLGARLAAYGAAAKGTVLLNYCEIGRDLIDFVVDRSPHKQGRFVPGVRIPIAPPEELLRENPDYTLLLAWNFATEIIAQQESYRRAGGRFVVPIPVPAIL